MGKYKKFNKKEAVKFELIPGKDENGNPTVMFKPVETKNKLSERQRNKIIQQISDYQIQIDGKIVNESDLPAFVLDQIKGRADLVFNQKNPDMWFNEQDNEDLEEGEDMQDEEDEWDEEEGELIPQQQYMGYQDQENIMKCVKNEYQQIKEKEVAQQVTIDGSNYKLTEKQKKLLEVVLPENYDNYEIQGVEFVKYDVDGIRVDEKEKSGKYIAASSSNRAVLDSYDFVPDKHVNIVDNDLQGEVLKGDMKDLDEALNFDGQEDAYEEMEDDFFSKLIDGKEQKKTVKKEMSGNQGFKKKQGEIQTGKAQKKTGQTTVKTLAPKQQAKVAQEDQQDEDYEDCEQQITDQMLDKALEQYDRKGSSDSIYSESGRRIDGTGIPYEMKGAGMELIKFIEERDGCTGRDGQLDWRTLTKKQKRQYMKNKKIREIIDEVREREITQKLKDKQNVTAEQLHLKQYISHIPYQQDHVMQESIQRCKQEIVNLETMENDEDYSTDSEEDDIVSYRAKTSIISSNLATVEQVSSRPRKNKQDKQEEAPRNIEKVKVVLEKRNKNQTDQQRKQRKQKLKELKKLKKQQKKQFGQIFEGERKKVMKRDNGINSNPLHKVAHIKMF